MSTTEQLYAARTFDEFWEHYQEIHAARGVRLAHAAATSIAALLLVRAALRRSWRTAMLAPLVDHLVAQASHRAGGERTDPMRRPLWHARAELRLWRSTVRSLRQGRGGRRDPITIAGELPPISQRK